MTKQSPLENGTEVQPVDTTTVPTSGNEPGDEPSNEPKGKFNCPYCSDRWSATLAHDDYADAAESAERGTAWAQASALWLRAAEATDDVDRRNRYLDAAVRCDREVEVDKLLAGIARRKLRVPTLDERKSDRLDFHEVDVWSLRRALWSAYRAGRDAK